MGAGLSLSRTRSNYKTDPSRPRLGQGVFEELNSLTAYVSVYVAESRAVLLEAEVIR